MTKALELIGKVFGRWTVLSRVPNNGRYGFTWWLVKCECGRTKEVVGASLMQKQSTSCGYCVPKKKTTAPGESAKWSLFNSHRINAARRGLAFTLGLEDFLRITGAACHYCGVQWSSEYPNQKYTENSGKKNLVGKNKLNGTYKHNGIDRINSNIGYVSDNCVPCCADCNFAKQRMTPEHFETWIIRVYSHYIAKNSLQLQEVGA